MYIYIYIYLYFFSNCSYIEFVNCELRAFQAWSVPFLIRARQCVITAKHAPDAMSRDLQRINLAKWPGWNPWWKTWWWVIS